MRAIDTNVLVRALVRDDTTQSARAEALLSEHRIFIPVTVMLELEWVLRSRYAFRPKVPETPRQLAISIIFPKLSKGRNLTFS